MSREFFVPCAPYAYPECGSSDGAVVSSEVNGMDCMPLRPGPFHYLISEQAKSLVALQELQNEVGALLEFRDLVIETFPNLRNKMAAVVGPSSSSSSTTTAVVTVVSASQTSSHAPLPLTSVSSSRHRIGEWEPGKVRRRVPQTSRETTESSSGSSLPRSRSNSHSGGGGKNSATVQDSGFSTETSSKDSASTAIPRPASPRPLLDEAEDELWNLLDVIHRKGIRLREEVESLQGRLESVAPDDASLGLSGDVLEAVTNVTRTSVIDDDEDIANLDDDERKRRIGSVIDESEHRDTIDETQVSVLRREKERLLDKVDRLEAETTTSRARALELEDELATLSALRASLEDRLRLVSRERRNDVSSPISQRKQRVPSLVRGNESLELAATKNGAFVDPRSGKRQSTLANVGNSGKAHKNRFRTRTIEKNVLANIAQQPSAGAAAAAAAGVAEIDPLDFEAAARARRLRLGALDSILVSPTRVAHAGNVDGVKIAAILGEHSSLELQRHLITTTVHNQCLQNRLDEVEKSTERLSERLDRAREENDDLRFQLEERNIELEGTRARVRVLERLRQRAPTEIEPEPSESEPRCEPCCPEPGSSTESARDHDHRHNSTNESKPSPRKRPSRIPLPGTKPTAPKPPGSSGSGKNETRESLKSFKSLTTRPPRDSGRDGGSATKSSPSSSSSLMMSRGGTTTGTRDSSRESLDRQSVTKTSGKEASRESLNRSLSRNNNSNRDSINKTSLSRNRDSFDNANVTNSNNNINNGNNNNNNNNNNNHNNNVSLYPPGTPPRRPPAPARRSQSLARPGSADADNDNGKVRTSKLPFWMSNWMK